VLSDVTAITNSTCANMLQFIFQQKRSDILIDKMDKAEHIVRSFGEKYVYLTVFVELSTLYILYFERYILKNVGDSVQVAIFSDFLYGMLYFNKFSQAPFKRAS